jgi:hypothetical protein
MMRASLVPDVIYRGDAEKDCEWMIVIHETQKVFIVQAPLQGSLRTLVRPMYFL